MKDSDNSRIDLNTADLPEVKDKAKIVINLEDLPAEDEVPKVYPTLANTNMFMPDKDKGKKVSNVLWHLALAGLIGGIFSWGITEFFFSDEVNYMQTYLEVLVEMTLYSAIIGGVIGACLGAIEGITSQVSQKTYKGIYIGLAFGAGGGAVGGFLGQIIYSFLGGGVSEDMLLQIIARTLAWGLIGLFIGLGQGIGSGGGKKTTNGLLGGLIGGFIGGLLFDIIGDFTVTAVLSRAIAIPIIGASTGLSIGVVQELRKEAWFKVLQGATTGKEYLVYSNKTLIGSSPKCDIVLIKDSNIDPQHAEISLENKSYFLRDLQSKTGIWVNNARVANHRLKNGEIVKIGNYALQYFDKNL